MRDMTGMVFERLTVIRYIGKRGTSQKVPHWVCHCICGEERIVAGPHLRSGHTKSCGCWARERSANNRTHGHSTGGMTTQVYNTWVCMRSRCTNKNSDQYPYYGGRGIEVCERWMRSFESFLEDMGKPPKHTRTLDRIDVDGHYEPSNCRWASRKDQARNRSSNSMLTFQGKTQCQSAWAEEMGISAKSLSYRITHGWSTERALTTPMKGTTGAERKQEHAAKSGQGSQAAGRDAG